MKYLITYDIEDDKKRKKISDELESFGYRVNYSVFECELNQTKLKKLTQRLEELVDKNTIAFDFIIFVKTVYQNHLNFVAKMKSSKRRIFLFKTIHELFFVNLWAFLIKLSLKSK